MSDVTLVQDDTRPSLNGTLTKTSDGTPFDLSDVSIVRFQMRGTDDKHYTVNEEAVIVDDPTDGLVRYDWVLGDLSRPGEYIAQWEMTFSDGTRQTTQPPNTITVREQ